jgi:drug/metabolite transporter (DMT)-like permease
MDSLQPLAPAARSERVQAVAALLLVMLIWGASAVFLRSTALTLAPENALALRYLVLAPLLAAGLMLRGGWRVDRSDWLRLIIASLAGMFGSAWFTMQGFARVAAGLGAVIQMVEPIIIALLAFALLAEPLSKRLWLGLAVSILGGAVLFWPDLSAAAGQSVNWWGVMALIGASFCFALYTILAKPLLKRHSSFTVTAWAILISTPPVLILASRPYAELLSTTPAATWAEIVYLAAVNSILGNVLWTYGTHRLPGATVGSFLYLMPVFAVIAAFFWLGEPITWHLVTGGLVILAGVMIAQSRG